PSFARAAPPRHPSPCLSDFAGGLGRGGHRCSPPFRLSPRTGDGATTVQFPTGQSADTGRLFSCLSLRASYVLAGRKMIAGQPWAGYGERLAHDTLLGMERLRL